MIGSNFSSPRRIIGPSDVDFPEAFKQAKGHIFRSAAEKDPSTVLSVMAKLGFDASDVHSSINSLIAIADTEEK